MSNAIEKKFSIKDGVKLKGLLKAGYDDYVSARMLINKSFLLQGSILANTAIEKYLKAILVFKGEPFKYTHKTTVLVEKLIGFDDKLYHDLDLEFIASTEDSYLYRYLDAVPAGKVLSLVQRKLISNLDYTILLFAEKFKSSVDADDTVEKTKYYLDRLNQNQDLYENNYILNKINKKEFLSGIDNVYEIHTREEAFYEMIYQTEVKIED